MPELDRTVQISARRTALTTSTGVAGWAWLLGRPRSENARSQRMARLGALCSVVALITYLVWRIGFTLPSASGDLVAAWILVAFETVPLLGIVVRMITLWNIDTGGPDPVHDVVDGLRTTVFIPTYNEPVEVIAPTIAAACELAAGSSDVGARRR